MKILKILTLEQMLQRLLIVFVQVKSRNTSENLLNDIWQIVYSLYRLKEVTQKLYNNIMNSIRVKYKNGYYIFMNSENSKTGYT